MLVEIARAGRTADAVRADGAAAVKAIGLQRGEHLVARAFNVLTRRSTGARAVQRRHFLRQARRRKRAAQFGFQPCRKFARTQDGGGVGGAAMAARSSARSAARGHSRR